MRDDAPVDLDAFAAERNLELEYGTDAQFVAALERVRLLPVCTSRISAPRARAVALSAAIASAGAFCTVTV